MNTNQRVEILRAQADNWMQVREIRLRALSADPKAFGQSWEKESTYDQERWLDRIERIAWFLAVEGDMPIGLVASRREEDSPENERELQAMWVQSSHRGVGVAQKLANAVFEWAKADGADTITLYVHPENRSAFSLYESLGFAKTGDIWRVVEDDPGADWVKMARPLK